MVAHLAITVRAFPRIGTVKTLQRPMHHNSTTDRLLYLAPLPSAYERRTVNTAGHLIVHQSQQCQTDTSQEQYFLHEAWSSRRERSNALECTTRSPPFVASFFAAFCNSAKQPPTVFYLFHSTCSLSRYGTRSKRPPSFATHHISIVCPAVACKHRTVVVLIRAMGNGRGCS